MTKEFKLMEKNKDIVEYFMEIIAKRDEGITASIKQMDIGIGKAFGSVQFMFAVVQKALESLGVTRGQIESIVEELKVLAEKGGSDNVAEETVGGVVETSFENSTEVSGEGEFGENKFE